MENTCFPEVRNRDKGLRLLDTWPRAGWARGVVGSGLVLISFLVVSVVEAGRDSPRLPETTWLSLLEAMPRPSERDPL